ncbi:MAG: nucleotidyltransferase family protein [Clostridia bacterium]|nr:nucleotidyltransferase family protein [Clostridia bacterium]MBQ4156715.1 nucleotidyltransferase family protein [Clostridia bacterium]
MVFTEEQKLVLSLLKSVFAPDASIEIPEDLDVKHLSVFSQQQGVLSFVIDQSIRRKLPISNEWLSSWQILEYKKALKNERMMKAQNSVISWFEKAGISSIILKGTSSAAYYPHPEVRSMGDIDILVERKRLEDACRIMEENGYKQLELTHEYHVVYVNGEIFVEIHHTASDVPDSPGGDAAKSIMEGFLTGIQRKNVLGYEIPVMAEENQGIILMIHIERHMQQGGVGFRQLMDWAAFFSKTDRSFFTDRLLPMFDSCGLKKFALAVSKLCAVYLGVHASDMDLFEDIDDELCDMLMENLIRSGNMGKAEKGSLRGMFADRDSAGSDKKHGFMRAFIKKAKVQAQRNFPAAKKLPFLLPVFIAYLLIRYKVRMLVGLRPKVSVKSMVSSARENADLYQALELYEIPKKKKEMKK